MKLKTERCRTTDCHLIDNQLIGDFLQICFYNNISCSILKSNEYWYKLCSPSNIFFLSNKKRYQKRGRTEHFGTFCDSSKKVLIFYTIFTLLTTNAISIQCQYIYIFTWICIVKFDIFFSYSLLVMLTRASVIFPFKYNTYSIVNYWCCYLKSNSTIFDYE